MCINLAKYILPVEEHLTENIFFKWILVMNSMFEVVSIVELWTRVVFMRWLVGIWREISFGGGDAVWGESSTTEPGGLNLLNLLHSLAMLLVQEFDLLLLTWGSWIESLCIPFKFAFVTNYKRFETENVDVAFVLEWRNDGLRKLTLLKNVDQNRWEVLVFRKCFPIVLVDVVLVYFFS